MSAGYDLEYRSFSFKEWRETGIMRGVAKGGTINRILTTVRESGSIPVSGYPVNNDMVKIYATDRETGERNALATMRLARPSSATSRALVRSGAVNLSSVLTFAEQDGPDGAYVVEQGQSPVQAAADIFSMLGLPVHIMEESAYVLGSTKVYMVGNEYGNWLDIANDLLNIANFSSADIDRNGTIIMRPYRELADQSPVVYFSDRTFLDTSARNSRHR